MATQKAATRSQRKSTGKATRSATTSRRNTDVTEKDYDKAYTRWMNGDQIKDLAAELGIRRGALRHHLTRRAGGRDEFKALRTKGAGTRRASLGEAPRTSTLDKGAKVLRPNQTKNWRVRHVVVEEGESPVPIFVTKGGDRYAPAKAGQKADVLKMMANGLPPARLVKYAPAE